MADVRKAVREIEGVNRERFHDEIVPANEPVVLRRLVSDWPVVAAARQSDEAVCRYVDGFDRGVPMATAMGPPEIGGRLFYRDDLSDLNFQMKRASLRKVLGFLLSNGENPAAPAIAIQSIPIGENLSGFERENANPLLDPDIDPRIWIGNRVTVAAHYDMSENIACVVAGRRRFTVFPPEQLENLYLGPMELTPAGPQVSLVDLDAPDLERYPRFAEALNAAQAADLEPGDAIYIPYLWWHHVRSFDSVSMLVNYWWTRDDPDIYGDPRDVLIHALVAIKKLPPAHRRAWRAWFDHFVFSEDQDHSDHLAEARRGILGDVPPELAKVVLATLSKQMPRR